jgi:hypothetical protein
MMHGGRDFFGHRCEQRDAGLRVHLAARGNDIRLRIGKPRFYGAAALRLVRRCAERPPDFRENRVAPAHRARLAALY